MSETHQVEIQPNICKHQNGTDMKWIVWSAENPKGKNFSLREEYESQMTALNEALKTASWSKFMEIKQFMNKIGTNFATPESVAPQMNADWRQFNIDATKYNIQKTYRDGAKSLWSMADIACGDALMEAEMANKALQWEGRTAEYKARTWKSY